MLIIYEMERKGRNLYERLVFEKNNWTNEIYLERGVLFNLHLQSPINFLSVIQIFDRIIIKQQSNKYLK